MTSSISTFDRFLDFGRDPITVGRRLLGQRLVRVLDGQRLSGRIVEVEAYLGRHDRAAHTFNGRRTARNESMYLGGGHAYIYFTYGMHYCFNVVCGQPGDGIAVLIRALEPEEGIELMYRHRFSGSKRKRTATHVKEVNRHVLRNSTLPPRTALCSGPAKLTQALALDRRLDGIDLRTSRELFIERLRQRSVPARAIGISPRIGVAYAGDCAHRPLRFFLHQSPHVSA